MYSTFIQKIILKSRESLPFSLTQEHRLFVNDSDLYVDILQEHQNYNTMFNFRRKKEHQNYNSNYSRLNSGGKKSTKIIILWLNWEGKKSFKIVVKLRRKKEEEKRMWCDWREWSDPSGNSDGMVVTHIEIKKTWYVNTEYQYWR